MRIFILKTQNPKNKILKKYKEIMTLLNSRPYSHVLNYFQLI